MIRSALRNVIQPDLVPIVTGSPDSVCSVSVHGCRHADPGPGRRFDMILVLQNAVALWALARFTVGSDTVAGWAELSVCCPVAELSLLPPTFDRGLSKDDILVDSPLAGCPLQDLPCRAGELTAYQRRELRRLWTVSRGKEPSLHGVADSAVGLRVHWPGLGARRFANRAGTLSTGRQPRTRREGIKMDITLSAQQ